MLEKQIGDYEIKLCEQFKVYQKIDTDAKVKYCGISDKFPKCQYLSNIKLQLEDKDADMFKSYRLCNNRG